MTWLIETFSIISITHGHYKFKCRDCRPSYDIFYKRYLYYYFDLNWCHFSTFLDMFCVLQENKQETHELSHDIKHYNPYIDGQNKHHYLDKHMYLYTQVTCKPHLSP